MAGCVPSKALLRAARLAAEARGASTLGIRAADAHLRSRLTPTLKKLTSRWLAWTR